ncbi:unnamed protein product [Durusdinium trenchii]|uniref:RRM domain-containing protein n=1 Tax=Durusdinium trenchii TaxID=1381693 RepID=A0ABP0M290_9DINO
MEDGDKHKLFVGSLPPDITDEEITSTFGTYGNVVEHHIMRGKSTSGQACAFVVLDSKAAGDNAISSMDNTMPVREGGTPIRVSWAKKGGGGGSYGGASVCVCCLCFAI